MGEPVPELVLAAVTALEHRPPTAHAVSPSASGGSRTAFGSAGEYAHGDLDAVSAGSSVPSSVRTVTLQIAQLMQAWLAEQRFTSSRLILLTRNAVVMGAV